MTYKTINKKGKMSYLTYKTFEKAVKRCQVGGCVVGYKKETDCTYGWFLVC
jgi:hypothetical protein